MEKIKQKYLIVLLITGFILLVNCCNRKEQKQIKKIVNKETFDINQFKKDSRKLYDDEYNLLEKEFPGTNTYQKNIYRPVTNTLQNGTKIERIFLSDEDGYIVNIFYPYPSIYIDQRTFYPSGQIKGQLKNSFQGYISPSLGLYEGYNEKGELIKTKDYNKQYNEYKIKIEDVIKILEKNNYIKKNKLVGTNYDISNMSLILDKGIWYINYNITEYSQRNIQIDAQTGDILLIEKYGGEE